MASRLSGAMIRSHAQAEDVGAAAAEHRRGRTVEIDEAAVRVERHDAVERRAHDLFLEPFLAADPGAQPVADQAEQDQQAGQHE